MTLPIPDGFALFAQEAFAHGGVVVERTAAFGVAEFVIFLVFLVGGIIITAVVLGTRYARYERELEHAERMKALETGRTLPKDAPFWTPNRLCVAIAGAMPIALFVLAFVASGFEHELMPYAWSVAGALGGIGIICGTLLALLLPRVEVPTTPSPSTSKPLGDPDAFDVVSSRAWAEAEPTHRN